MSLVPSTQARVQAGSWDQPDYSREVLREVRTTEAVEVAWARGRGLGMRLWDGLKRVWRWIVRGVKRIVEVGVNVARAFFTFATKAYQIVRTALAAAGRAIIEYARGEIDLPRPVRVFIDHDGDAVTWLPEGASGQDLAAAAASVSYFGAAFVLACQILGSLMRVLREAAMDASVTVVGWARFLWVLVRVYRDVRRRTSGLTCAAASSPTGSRAPAVRTAATSG